MKLALPKEQERLFCFCESRPRRSTHGGLSYLCTIRVQVAKPHMFELHTVQP